MSETRTARTAPRAVSTSVASARRKLGTALFVSKLGPALVIAGAAAAVLVFVVKVWGSRLGLGELGLAGWAGLILMPIVIAILWAGLIARRLWPSAISSASQLDEASDTHDLLGSSLAFSARTKVGAFERWAIRDAEAAADSAATNEVGELRFGTPWIVGFGTVALAGVLAWLAPMREPPLPGPSPIVRAQSAEAVTEAASKVAKAKEAIEAAATTGQVSDQELAAIEELERELAEGLREPEEAVAAAAQTLQRSADEAAKRAERERAMSEAVRERLSSISPESLGDSSQLAEDLSSGDFEAAAAEAERLLDAMQNASPEEREQLANELRELAEQIEQQQSEEEQSEAEDPAQQEEPTPEPEPKTPEEIRDQLEREGVPPEDAQRLADEIHEEQQRKQEQQQTEDEASERASEIAEELRQEAEELSPSEESDPSQQNPSGDQNDQQQGNEQGQEGEPKPEPGQQQEGGEQGQGDKQSGQEGQEQSGSESEQKKESGEQQGEGQQQGEEKQGQPKEGESKEGQQQEGGEGENPKEGQGQEQGQQSQGDGQGEGEGQEPGSQPGGQQGTQPGDQPGTQEGQGQQSGEGGGEGQGQGDSEPKGIGNKLRQMAQQQKQANESGDSARNLQKQADEITGGQSGGEGLRDLADQLPPATPWEGQTEFVDARPEGQPEPEREQIISEWFNPSAKPGEETPTGRINPGRTVRLAEERAQRALEQQAVPRRHADLIKRVFDRFGERARQAAPGSPPPADAEDAP